MTLPGGDLRNREFRNILLIKLSAVGDVVHTIPLMHKLRRRYSNARLDWLAISPIAELLRHDRAISNVIAFPREKGRLPPFMDYVRLAGELRAAAYDLVVDIHGQFRTALLTMATGAPVRIGFDRPRATVWKNSTRTFPAAARKHAWQGAREGSWIAYTHHIRLGTLDLHAVDRYLTLGPILGLDEDAPDFAIPLPESAVSRLDSLLRRHGIAGRDIAALAPGTTWETKHWGSGGFADVARHLMGRGFAAVLIGSERERAVCENVARQAAGAVNLAGETNLPELAALIGRSSICVTNDSGPMHLAVALDRPVVSIFGPTDPVWIGPYGRANAVLHAGLSCSPCYLRQLSRCPHGHACMREVPASAVIERIEDTLAAANDHMIKLAGGA